MKSYSSLCGPWGELYSWGVLNCSLYYASQITQEHGVIAQPNASVNLLFICNASQAQH